MTPSIVYEIMNFYSDLGPEKDLEFIVREKIRLDEKKIPVSSSHVIKERTIDKIGQKSNLLAPVSAKYNSKGKEFLNNKNNVKDSKKFFQSKIAQASKNNNGKGKSKWPEIQPHYAKDSKANIENKTADGVIKQLINLRKLEERDDQVCFLISHTFHYFIPTFEGCRWAF